MDNTSASQIKPRKWWIAGLLSIIQPGLGQIYNGQAKKGILFFLLQMLVWASFLPILVKYPFILAFVAFYLLLPSVYIYIAVDAILNARRIGNNYLLKSYNRLFVYIGTFISIAVISDIGAFTIKHYIVQAYKIPAASMEPTLLIGDHILIDKLGSSTKNPARGDIIVFEYYGDPQKAFIKRVVGIGGDTIEVRDKELYVNNLLVKNDYVVHADAKIFPKGEEHRDNYGPVTVPSNSFFVLGDNRDRSFDSRYWGFVEKSKIHGIAKCIYWSWDTKSRSVRWQRIGQRVR